MNPQDEHFNPFPGLRPFQIEEKFLFFGREDQTAELLTRLRKTRFLAVVGVSGSGKSSLVRAGLLPELHGGTMATAGSSWEVAVMRPGGDPLANLAEALIEADIHDAEEEQIKSHVRASLARSGMGLVESIKQGDLPEKTNLLLVVDQFEEIFRFRRMSGISEEEAGHFITLLLEASEQADIPIYVVLTMRSDFLGDCAQFRGLAEAVNEGEYLIPRLNRNQRRQAIEGPARVGGREITTRLVQRLLNDIGDDPDQLPILQHALMRTWDHWAESGADGSLDLDHYQATGGMAEALSRHADEVHAGLPDDDHRWISEKLFKALTEKVDQHRGIRRPMQFLELCEIIEKNEDQLHTVIDAFRKKGRTFLMPSGETEITPKTVIDISHESLMRAWRRLRDWVDDEAQSAKIYRRLADTSSLYQEGKAGFYRDPDLQIALSWREESKPNKTWADHYFPGFEEAMAFLDNSHNEAVAEEKAREEARQRELEQARRLAEEERRSRSLWQKLVWTLAGTAMVVVGFLINTINQKNLISEQKIQIQNLFNTFSLNEANRLNAEGKSTDSIKQLSDTIRRDPTFTAASSRLVSIVDQSWFPVDKTIILKSTANSIPSFWATRDWENNFVTIRGVDEDNNDIFEVINLNNESIALTTKAKPNEKYVNGANASGVLKQNYVAHAVEIEIESLTSYEIHVYEIIKNKLISKLKLDQGVRLRRFDIMHNSTILVSALENGKLTLWDIHSGKVINSFMIDKDPSLLLVSKDDKTIFTSSQKGESIITLYTPNGVILDKFSLGYENLYLRRPVLSKDTQTIGLIGFSNPDRINLTVGLNTKNIKTPNGVYAAGSISQDSTLSYTQKNGKVFVNDTLTGDLISSYQAHETILTTTAISPDQKVFATGSLDRTVKFWDAETGQQRSSPIQFKDEISKILFKNDGKFLFVILSNGDIHKVSAIRYSSQPIIYATNHRQENAYQHIPKRGLLSQQLVGNRIVIWDTNKDKHILSPLSVEEEFISSVNESSDSLRIFTIVNEKPKVRIYDFKTGKIIMEDWFLPENIHGVKFAKNSDKFLMVGKDYNARMANCLDNSFSNWNLNIPTRFWLPMPFRLYDMLFIRDDKLLIDTRNGISIFDVNTGLQIGKTIEHGQNRTSIKFNESENSFLTFNDDDTLNEVRLYKFNNDNTSKLVLKLPHSYTVSDAVFSPSGNIIASSTMNGVVKLWNIDGTPFIDGDLNHSDAISSMAFHPNDQSKLFVITLLGQLFVWDLNNSEVLYGPVDLKEGFRADLEFTENLGDFFILGRNLTRKWNLFLPTMNEQKPPSWLFKFGTSLGNIKLTQDGDEVILEQEEVVDGLKIPKNSRDKISEWARWYTSNELDRTMSFNSKVKIKDNINTQLELGSKEGLEQVLSYDPLNPQAISKLAGLTLENSLLSQESRKLRAVWYAEKAVELEPRSRENWLRLASVYKSVGNTENERVASNKAAELKN